MNFDLLLEKLEELVSPPLADLKLELVEREFVVNQGRWILRLYISREEGVTTLEDCEKASRMIEALLDVENLIPKHYVLEISSPGVDRPLRRLQDFEKYIGATVDMKIKELIEGRTHFHGKLKRVENNNEVILEEMGREWKIPLKLLKKARLKTRCL